MNRLFTFSAIAFSALSIASCSNQDEPAVPGTQDGHEIKVCLNLPASAPVSRSAQDWDKGASVNKLHYAVYSTDGTLILQGTRDPKSANYVVTDRFDDFTIRLADGVDYVMIFFADSQPSATGLSPYTFDAANKKMTKTPNLWKSGSAFVTYTFDGTSFATATRNAVQPIYDCYYAKVSVVKGTQTINATLKRPVAQLNIGTNDLEDESIKSTAAYGFNNSGTVTTAVFTSYTIAKADYYTEFDLWNEEAGAAASADFTSAFKHYPAATTDLIRVGANEYKYLESDFIIVPKAGKSINLTINHGKYNATGKTVTTLATHNVTDVPFAKNKQTNIYGSLLSKEKTVHVIVQDAFETSANNKPVTN